MYKQIKSVNRSLKYLLLGNCSISHIEKLIIGEGCRIGDGCLINAGGGLEIGNNVIFAPNVVIWTQNHNFINANMLPYDSGIKNKKVTIGANCWFGEGVKIAPGVSIGEGVILAMGSVVLDDIASFLIAMLNVAKVKKVIINTLNCNGLHQDVASFIINKLIRST